MTQRETILYTRAACYDVIVESNYSLILLLVIKLKVRRQRGSILRKLVFSLSGRSIHSSRRQPGHNIDRSRSAGGVRRGLPFDPP